METTIQGLGIYSSCYALRSFVDCELMQPASGHGRFKMNCLQSLTLYKAVLCQRRVWGLIRVQGIGVRVSERYALALCICGVQIWGRTFAISL